MKLRMSLIQQFDKEYSLKGYLGVENLKKVRLTM